MPKRADISPAILNAICPGVQAEYRFCERRWRFDYAWPDLFVALEIEGGTWKGGRHTSGIGYRNDCQKYNRAAILGWTVIRVTSDMVRDGTAHQQIEEAIAYRRSVGVRDRDYPEPKPFHECEV